MPGMMEFSSEQVVKVRRADWLIGAGLESDISIHYGDAHCVIPLKVRGCGTSDSSSSRSQQMCQKQCAPSFTRTGGV